MKTFAFGIALALTLAGAGSAANAQRGDFDRDDRPQWRDSGRNRDYREDRRNDTLFRDAKDRIDAAQTRLRRALPVYGRERVDALEKTLRAERELDQALFGSRRGDFRQPVASFERERGRNERFSERDIRRSNGEMIEGRRELQRAEDALEKARPDDGHRREALEAIRGAIRDIDQALRRVRA